ncbi:MAG TPA: PIG-L family deacetylase [Patescibacteria group bacterium]|nr:PIG-L family deacetylase [Patescibacteria group bacterium]
MSFKIPAFAGMTEYVMIQFNFKGLKILSISAHPDDEIGGAGGFLVAAKKGGARFHFVLALTPCEDRFECDEKEEQAQRLREFDDVADYFAANTSYLDIDRYPQMTMENICLLVKEIRAYKPDLILTPSNEEHHSDHRALYNLTKEAIWQAGRAAFPGLGEPHKTRTWLSYETDNAIAQPNFLFDITDHWEDKKNIFELYRSQTGRKDLVSALLGLNRFRGIMFKGGEYAEAYNIKEFFYG